jgi:hypothetical protein
MNRPILFSVLTTTVLLSSCGFPTSRRPETKLILNSRDGSIQIVHTLLERGYIRTIDGRDENGNTALMLASEQGYRGIVRLLLEKGADNRLMNDRGETAFTLAESHGRAEVIQLLKSRQSIFLQGKIPPIPVGNRPVDIVMGDVNKDGKLDIVVANSGSNNITVLLNNGTGGFKPAPGSPHEAGPGAHNVVLGDLNKDGNMDMAVTAHDTYRVTVLLGDGRGNFSPAQGSPFATIDEAKPHNHGLAIGDVNNDGNLDLVTSNHGNNSVSILLGNGKGGLSPPPGSPFLVGRGPYPLALGNVNGDGNLDIVTPNVSSNNVTVLLGDGRGNFAPAAGSPHSVATRPYYVALGDINGDKKIDLIVTHDDIAKMSLLLGDGKGGFGASPASPVDIGRRAYKVIVVDINRDGKMDLVMNNPGSQSVTVLLGDGKGNFRPEAGSPYRIDGDPNGIALGDVNGNGKLDLATANWGSNDIRVLFAK